MATMDDYVERIRAARLPQGGAFFSMPNIGSGLSSAAPGVMQAAESVYGAGRSAIPALSRVAGTIATPALEYFREREVYADPESTFGDLAASGARSTARIAGSIAGAGIGQAAIPIPVVGAALGGLAGYAAPDLFFDEPDRPSRIPGISNAAAAAPAPAAQAAPTTQLTPYIARPAAAPVTVPSTPIQAMQQSALAAPSMLSPPRTPALPRASMGTSPAQQLPMGQNPALPDAPQYSYQTAPEVASALNSLNEQNARLNELSERYTALTGQVIPKDMDSTDKWSILAAALGTAAMVGANPEYGLLGGLGAGALIGSGAYQNRKGALMREAQAGRKAEMDIINAQRQLYNDSSMRAAEALKNSLEIDKEGYDRFNDARTATLNERKQADLNAQFNNLSAYQKAILEIQRANAARAARGQAPLVAYRTPSNTTVYIEPRAGLEVPANYQMVMTGGRGGGALGPQSSVRAEDLDGVAVALAQDPRFAGTGYSQRYEAAKQMTGWTGASNLLGNQDDDVARYLGP